MLTATNTVEKRFLELIEKIKVSSPESPLEQIEAAFEYAREAHSKQVRKTGEPYIIHPLETAVIVAEMGLDADSIMAALLHDCIEDTGATYEDIEKRFGKEVAELVDGVTKLTRVPYSSKEEQQMENLRKMFLAMAKDIRVILIKIADRLHNIRTLNYVDEKKQREKALETMEIYAPIAHRLGMQRIKWELEDRSLFYLDPVGYKEIQEGLNQRSTAHAEFLENIKEAIYSRLVEAGIECEINGRVKHIYSIYRKMYTQNKTMDEVYDLYAVRVIVDTVADCYNVLGFVHDLYKPVPGRFKDYISTPKPNMYQSLHTTVIGRAGIPFEVQIRTHEMHNTAEYGIAAHWKYKAGVSGRNEDMEQKLKWVRQLLEAQQDTDAEDFIRTLKIDMFDDEVFVFTPKGDLINLPAGATPIDFAYAIHSAVGNRMTGAKANGRIITFDYQLQNGDIIEILTSGQSHGPSRDWIKMAKTNEARNKIRQWFKKERREENIAQGREELERELKRAGIPFSVLTNEELCPVFLKKLSFATLDELCAGIGYGGITANKAANRIRDEYLRINKLKNEKATLEKLLQMPKKPRRGGSGIIVEGIDNCLVKFSRCCTPVPGDDIIGFITKGYGVSVHRKDCVNYRVDEKSSNRWVNVSWVEDIKDTYQTHIQVSSHERSELVLDIAAALSGMKVPLRSIEARDLGDGYAVVNIVLEVNALERLENIINRLSRISGVIEVTRSSAS